MSRHGLGLQPPPAESNRVIVRERLAGHGVCATRGRFVAFCGASRRLVGGLRRFSGHLRWRLCALSVKEKRGRCGAWRAVSGPRGGYA